MKTALKWRVLICHSFGARSIFPCDNLLVFQEESNTNVTQLVRNPIKRGCATYNTGEKVRHTRSQHSFSTPVVKGLKFCIEKKSARYMELLFQQNIMPMAPSQIFLMTQVLLRFDEQGIGRYLPILKLPKLVKVAS